MAGNVAPNIVTDGLRLCIDGANIYSYPGVGSTWSDLTTNRNNFSLVNGPTYDSSNGGSILFDGVNDYANITYNSTLSVASSHTIETWFYSTGKGTGAIFDGSGILIRAGQIQDMSYGMNYVYDFQALSYGWWTSPTGFRFILSNTGITAPNKWNQAIVTRDGSTVKFYANGVLDKTYTGETITTNSSWGTYLGGSLTLGLCTGNSSINYKGRIAITRLYSKPLSDLEVLQNFNAHKGRFNL